MFDSDFSQEEYEAILRCDFNSFVERSFAEINPHETFFESQHIPLINAALQKCVEGQCNRLILCMPPRSLKSLGASVALPALILGRQPHKKIICVSYGQELADKHARDCRLLMSSQFYKALYPRTRLSPTRSAVSDFATTAGGGRMATSVGGVLTGRGADFIIIDDPIKPGDALSEKLRNDTNEWHDNSLSSRLNSKKDGVIIIVMQRLHQDDLVGHVTSQSDAWEVLSLPAIAEEEENYVIEAPLGPVHFHRAAGDLLEPTRDTREILDLARNQIGSFNFSAQYQQNPIPMNGTTIDRGWLQYYDPAGHVDRGFILQSWDTASKSGELNDYSVCTTWAIVDKQRFLVDVFRQKLEYPDLKKAIVEQFRKHKPHEILIEDHGSGTQLIQDLRRDGLLQVKPYRPPSGMDKLMRLRAVSVEFEAGNVLLPKTAPWLDSYINELMFFPGGKYDDQVDSTTQALAHAAETTLDVWARLGRADLRPMANRLSLY